MMAPPVMAPYKREMSRGSRLDHGLIPLTNQTISGYKGPLVEPADDAAHLVEAALHDAANATSKGMITRSSLT